MAGWKDFKSFKNFQKLTGSWGEWNHDYAIIIFSKFPACYKVLIFFLGSKAQLLFITLKKSIKEKGEILKQQWNRYVCRECSKSSNSVLAVRIYALVDFFSTRKGKSKLPPRDQFKEDGDIESLHKEENLVIPRDITPTSKSIDEKGQDKEPYFTFNTKKARKRASKIIPVSKSKWQGITGSRRNDLLNDMEFFLRNDLSCSGKKRKTSCSGRNVYRY